MPVLLSCRYKEEAISEKREVRPVPPSPNHPGQTQKDTVGIDTVLYSPVPAHLDSALTYEGITDGGNNRGTEVVTFLASVGLRPGNPWCAAFVSYVLEVAVWQKAEGKVEVAFPTVRSGLATHFITNRSIKASNVLMGIKKVPAGAVVIWRKGNGKFGHAALVKEWAGGKKGGITIEGNTSAPAAIKGHPPAPPSPNDSGHAKGDKIEDERDGEGVYVKRRTIQPANYFRIVSFTPVSYAKASETNGE